MTKKTFDAWRRADRAFLGALLVSFLTMGTAAAISSHTDHIPALRPSIVHEDAVASAAPVRTAETVQPAQPIIVIAPTADELAALKLIAQENCLAEAMYYEARGEGTDGELAVAEVIINRTHSRAYPHTICGVVYQGSSLDTGCQFSFTCNGEMDHAKTSVAWARAKALAVRILSGRLHVGGLTGGAIAFHAVDVSPDWGDDMSETVQIGNHIFYRRLPRTQAS